jgi:hypothetical protein
MLDKIKTGDPAKDDILKCLYQLADRASELGYKDLSCMLNTMVGSCIQGGQAEKDLHTIMHEFAEIQLMILQLQQFGFPPPEEPELTDEDEEKEK